MDAAKPLTKEERIAARRARVAARLSHKEGRRAEGEAADEADDQKNASLSEKQILKTRNRVDAVKDAAERALTELCAESNAAEAARRVEEEERGAARRERIEKELALSAEQHEAIREKWEGVADRQVPQDLYRYMSDVQQDCRALIARKDALIKSLYAEVKEKDESYNDMLTAQADEITEMVRRMRERYAGLVACYRQELASVEAASDAERDALIKGSKEESDALFAQRRALELRIIENQRRREDEFQEELAQIRARDAEEYNKLKVSLESNIQMLEQQLEEMRATYQLNTEKLDYNHRVLREMDTENKRTVKHHKQKLKRLKEALATVTARHEKQDSRFKQENSQLTDEYKRATEQFKDLQRKYRHFETVDSARYRELWEMNEETVLAVVDRVMQADQVVHERLLGLAWRPPALPERVLAAPGADGEAAAAGGAGEDAAAAAAAAGGAGEGAGEAAAAAAAAAAARGPTGRGRFSRRQIRRVMGMLAVDAAFLVDERVRERLREVPEEERSMHVVDCVLVALGVVDGDGLEELVSVFYGGDESADEPVVHANDVVSVLTSFVSDRQHLKKGGGGGGGGGGGAGGASSPAGSAPSSPKDGRPATGGEAVAGTVGSAKHQRNQRRQRERQYWVKLGDVLTGERQEVWDGLEKALTKYTGLLADRAELVEQTTGLSEQNAKLKALLQQYLRSNVNQELQIPPTRLVRASD